MQETAFAHIKTGNSKLALIDQQVHCSYEQLSEQIETMASALLAGRSDLQEERIAFMMPASIDYVVTLFAVWRAGGIAVPLNVHSALPEHEHVLSTAGVTRLLAQDEYVDNLQGLCASLGIALSTPSQTLNAAKGVSAAESLPELGVERRAMIVFTSGTTNKPKGVVSTHGNIRAQVTTLIDAWGWQSDDVIPLFLPLHHVHGIINILCCALWAGASVDLFKAFEAATVLSRVADNQYTVFMAVPTVYVKIIQYLESVPETDQQAICQGFKAMRLNVSGSAACPVPLFEQWQKITGQTLLERYGMTEMGMAISNPYDGERRAGSVGVPLPGVEVVLFDDNNQPVDKEGVAGEIRVKGDNVFLEYWNNPKATAGTFHDGWFCTGDVAVVEDGYFRIMGRSSVDIIKSGGYKLSALEIESVLLNHEAIAECAVIGVADATWGEAVTAFVVLKAGAELSLEGLKSWCADKMSSYKTPRALHVLAQLPRNAMGKVTKPALKSMV